ncbi:MAG: GTP-binding protein [Fusobacterium sp.]|uniref:GTP-binding protein n=1 Tax=Fusobacterium sp. TaxID=68766 RepID=UPI0026DB293F|nr:GTP-binding protein [Fusobacterium sp.]MDO4689763.1 GTP-binding protein [Fusobacterium sp.]
MKILIISGFLGAGKTTFIKHLAKNINMEFVVLENEYADIGMDKDILTENKLNVWEISEGCICCSMTGDFKNSIKNIYTQIDPEYLLIEPTGVGMLSSIINNIKAIKNNEIKLLNPISMIDVSCFNEYFENFKDYFIDNIKNTGKILLTKLENSSKFEIEVIKKSILEINPNIEIIDYDYRKLGNDFFIDIFNTDIEKKEILPNFKIFKHINLKTFSQVNIKISTMDEFGLFLNKIMDGNFGKIYRAKGLIQIDGQWGKFNLVHKNFEMEACHPVSESKIVVIGNNLDIKSLEAYLKK